MKIRVIFVGKTTEAYLDEGISLYEKRLKHYARVELEVVPGLKNTKSMSPIQQAKEEGEGILLRLTTKDRLILLDDKGKGMDSITLAKHLMHMSVTHHKNLVFVVGGAYGFSDAVYKRADEQLSLSQLTFSHQMVRLILLEQLYRAMTINKGEPYHHE